MLPSLDFAEILPLCTATTLNMNTADFWLMAREYFIWNAAIASLQVWTEVLNPVTLGRVTEHVYTTFLYSLSSHTLCQQSNETLFGHFVIALNAAFDQQLSLADEGYESGSDTIDLPIPLRKTPCIHHVSSIPPCLCFLSCRSKREGFLLTTAICPSPWIFWPWANVFSIIFVVYVPLPDWKETLITLL